jgi:hypothetical protein
MKQAVFLLLGCVLGALAGRAWWPTVAADATGSQRGPVEPVGAEPAADIAQRAPVALDRPAGELEPSDELLALLADISRRLDAIEARLGAVSRQPVAVPDEKPASQAELSREEAEQIMALEKALENARLEEERAALRFDLGFAVARIGREVGLDPVQRELLAEALIERETKRRDMELELDPLSQDPEDWATRFTALDDDFWNRVELDLGAALAEELRGHL